MIKLFADSNNAFTIESIASFEVLGETFSIDIVTESVSPFFRMKMSLLQIYKFSLPSLSPPPSNVTQTEQVVCISFAHLRYLDEYIAWYWVNAI